MRVALFVLEDFPGSENRVQRQALALNEAGHDVRVYAARGPSSCDSWHDMPVERLHVRRVKCGSMKRRLWEYSIFTVLAAIRCLVLSISWRPDVIQFASMPDWLVLCGLPARWVGGTKLVLDLHELMPELLDTKGDSRALRRLIELIEKASVKAADATLVPTPMCADIISERVDGIRPDVVLNGVDTRFFPDRTHGRNSGVLTVGYHGTLAHRFGMHVVIESVSRLIREGLDVRLVVVGDGDQRSHLEAHVQEVLLGDRVTFLGQQPASRIPEIAADFDVAVVPYLDSDFMRLAYPTKAFEYGALGVPMLASDLPSIRRLYADDEVRFVESGSVDAWVSALRWASAAESELAAQAKRARTRTLAEYAWDVWSPRYVALVERT